MNREPFSLANQFWDDLEPDDPHSLNYTPPLPVVRTIGRLSNFAAAESKPQASDDSYTGETLEDEQL